MAMLGRGSSRKIASVVFCAALLVVLAATTRSIAGEPDDVSALGILWSPDGDEARRPVGVVIALREMAIDRRGWRYGDQITAAGIAVLHMELLENSADGFGPAEPADDIAAAGARLAMAMDLLAADPRLAGVPLGLLAFGPAGQAALLAAADPAHVGRIAGVALLYPGCADLAGSLAAQRALPQSPVLLLHGDADPANSPAECHDLEARLSRFAPVRRRQYAGAGYAWDLAPQGLHETMKLPWPGRPGRTLTVDYWPEAAELAAAQVAAFFARSFAAHRR